MNAASTGICSRGSCANLIPPSLANEQVCLDHFLDDAFVRTGDAMQRCRQGRLVDAKGLERLLADALAIVSNLEEEEALDPAKRDRMLELLLSLANLHEYAAQHSLRSDLPS
jgi:hypothetical protein